MPIITYKGKTPKIGKNVFIAPGAMIIGDVTLEDNSSVWYNAVLRGDVAPIIIGKGSNVQDNATIHVNRNTPTILEDYVTVGHAAIVHGATVKEGSLIGIQAVVLSKAVVGAGSIIGSCALVPEGKEIPPLSLVMGVPGQVVRTLEEGQSRKNAENYLHHAQSFLEDGLGEDTSAYQLEESQS